MKALETDRLPSSYFPLDDNELKTFDLTHFIVAQQKRFENDSKDEASALKRNARVKASNQQHQTGVESSNILEQSAQHKSIRASCRCKWSIGDLLHEHNPSEGRTGRAVRRL